MRTSKKFIILAVVLFIAISMFGCASDDIIENKDKASTTNPPVEDSKLAAHIPQQVIIKFADENKQEEVIEEINGEVITQLEKIGALQVKLPPGTSVAKTINDLKNRKEIIYVQPNYRYRALVDPNDFRYQNGEQWGLKRIKAEEAWETVKGSSDIVVAVADTGVDLDHQDLMNKVLVDSGYNAFDSSSDADDDMGHGTHVAGIAGGITNNELGIAGVSWNSKILPIKVLDEEGSGSDMTVASGISYAADWASSHPEKRVVLNLSLGGEGYSNVLQDAVDYAVKQEVVVIAAMGNDYKSIYMYPAACQGVIAVGATNYQNEKPHFSTTGDWISVSAPGKDILSTIPGDEYARLSGTSMATPYVTGAAVLVLSTFPDLTPAEVKSQLEKTATDLGPTGFDSKFGYGLINLAEAVKEKQNSKFGVIEVEVINGNDEVIPEVNLILYDKEGNYVTTTRTNSDGLGIFRNIKSGDYYIAASYKGNIRQTNNLTLAEGEKITTRLEFVFGAV